MSVIESLDRLETRQLAGLLGGGVLLVTAAIVSYGVLPQIKTFQRETQVQRALEPPALNVAELEAQMKLKDEAVVARVKQLRGDMANVPAREIEANVIDRLQELAWRNEVVLEGVKPAAGQEIEPFQEVLFTLELRGRYNALYQWLQQLRQELGSIVIKEYQMNRVDQANEDPELRVKIVIASYQRETS